MAKKKVDEYKEEMTQPDLEKLPVCGHVNRHSVGVDGQLDNIKCYLPTGHAGPHRGKHMQRFSHHVVEKKHIVAEPYEDKEVESEWLDGAGVPVDPTVSSGEIKPKSLAEQEFGDYAKSVLGG